MSVPISNSFQPSGDDFFENHSALTFPESRKRMHLRLEELLNTPERFQMEVSWYLREGELESSISAKREKHEQLCEVLRDMQMSLILEREAAFENFTQVNALLLASCSVIHYFANNSKLSDPFPVAIYGILDGVLDLLSVFNSEYRDSTSARKTLADGLGFLSEALSSECDLGRWIPNSERFPMRARIAALLESSFGDLVQNGFPDVLPEENVLYELKLFDAEIKIAGALRLYELGESLPILMRRIIATVAELDDDDQEFLEFPEIVSEQLDNCSDYEKVQEVFALSVYEFVYTNILGSLVDSYGRISQGKNWEDDKENRDIDRENIYSLLVSNSPTWPAWPFCLRGYLKLSNNFEQEACNLLRDNLLPAIIEGSAGPQVLADFIHKDWEAEELTCYVLKAMKVDDFLELQRAIRRGSDGTRGSFIGGEALIETTQRLFHRQKPSYYASVLKR